MIKANQIFFSTSNLNDHGFDGEKAAIFYLTSEYYSLRVLSAKLIFLKSVQYSKSYGFLHV